MKRAAPLVVLLGLAACQAVVVPPPAVPTRIASLRSVQLGSLAMAIGGEKDLLPFIRAADTGKVPTEALAWTISNPALLTVDPATGRARALGTGTVVVTAQVPGQPEGAAQLIIDVTGMAPVKDVSIAPAAWTLVVGEQVTLVPTVRMPDGQVNQNVLWSSSDNTIAAVNPTTGEATALKPGSVTIVAAYAQDPRYQGLTELTIYADRSQIPVAPTTEPTSPPAPAATRTPRLIETSEPAPKSPRPSREPSVESTPTPTLAPTVSPTPEPTPTPDPTPTPAVESYSIVGFTPYRVAFDKQDVLWVTGPNNRAYMRRGPGFTGTYSVRAQTNDLALDSRGTGWIAATEGLIKIESAGGTEQRSVVVKDAKAIAIGGDDAMWVASGNGSPMTMVKLSPQLGKLATVVIDDQIDDVAVDRAKNAWFLAAGKLRKLSPAGEEDPEVTQPDQPTFIAADPDDGLWVTAAGTELWYLPSSGPTVVLSLGFRPTFLTIDRAGNPWVGSADGKTALKIAR